MSMRQRKDNDGGEERCVKIDEDSKKTNGWKNLKELKQYLLIQHLFLEKMILSHRDLVRL